MSFEWKYPTPPEPIVLEYNLIVPEENESSEKLGYLEQYIAPGDVIGVLDKDGNFVLEMLYDKYLCLVTFQNIEGIKFLPSGTKLYKACQTFLD